MRHGHHILGVLIAALLVGAGLYLYLPQQPQRPGAVAYEPTLESPAPAGPRTVAFRVIDSGTHASGVSARKNYAAYSQESFLKLWDMAHGTDNTVPPLIDFSKEYVIGVFAGEKPTGGYSIAVSSVTDEGDTRTVAITISKPGEGCMTTQAFTSPYQIVVVPRSTAILARSDSEITTPCE